MKIAITLLASLLLASPTFAAGPSDLGGSGKELYDAFCYVCHGIYGRGDGPAAKYLTPLPPDFTHPATLQGKSVEEIRRHLTPEQDLSERGHTPMLIGELLDDEMLEETIAYIRTMAVPGRHVSVLAGRDLYNGICWICHGVKGDGQGPAASKLGDAKPRDFTAPDFHVDGREEEIFRVISSGAEEVIHGSSFMIEWGTKLTPQQIHDIIEYLRTF